MPQPDFLHTWPGLSELKSNRHRGRNRRRCSRWRRGGRSRLCNVDTGHSLSSCIVRETPKSRILWLTFGGLSSQYLMQGSKRKINVPPTAKNQRPITTMRIVKENNARGSGLGSSISPLRRGSRAHRRRHRHSGSAESIADSESE